MRPTSTPTGCPSSSRADPCAADVSPVTTRIGPRASVCRGPAWGSAEREGDVHAANEAHHTDRHARRVSALLAAACGGRRPAGRRGGGSARSRSRGARRERDRRAGTRRGSRPRRGSRGRQTADDPDGAETIRSQPARSSAMHPCRVAHGDASGADRPRGQRRHDHHRRRRRPRIRRRTGPQPGDDRGGSCDRRAAATRPAASTAARSSSSTTTPRPSRSPTSCSRPARRCSCWSGRASPSTASARRPGCSASCAHIPAWTTSAAAAHGPNMIQPIPNPADQLPVGIAAYLADTYPEAIADAATSLRQLRRHHRAQGQGARELPDAGVRVRHEPRVQHQRRGGLDPVRPPTPGRRRPVRVLHRFVPAELPAAAIGERGQRLRRHLADRRQLLRGRVRRGQHRWRHGQHLHPSGDRALRGARRQRGHRRLHDHDGRGGGGDLGGRGPDRVGVPAVGDGSHRVRFRAHASLRSRQRRRPSTNGPGTASTSRPTRAPTTRPSAPW